MDEEMEYAEMLEIPVSTVNVTKKRGRKPKKTQDLKEKVITKVNDNADSAPAMQECNTQDAPAQTEIAGQEQSFAETPVPTPNADPISNSAQNENAVVSESIPIAIPRRRKRPFFARLFGGKENEWEYGDEQSPTTVSIEEQNADGQLPIYNYGLWNEEQESKAIRKEKTYSLIVGLEFAACFALCLGIFLTNVFMPNSAINTFFRNINNQQQADARTYIDFTLSSVFMEEDAALTLSETGILSFQQEGCVYPAVDGVVADVSQSADGTWLVKIEHSPTFSEIISGLSYASCSVGCEVKSNVPVGYSDGNALVQVSMYDEGALLNCFYVTENGSLAWTEE